MRFASAQNLILSKIFVNVTTLTQPHTAETIMYTCEHSSRGCPQIFQRRFGLRNHLRSCIHKERTKRLKKVVNPTFPAFPEQYSDRDLPIPPEEMVVLRDDRYLPIYGTVEPEGDVVPLEVLALLRHAPKHSCREFSPIDIVILKLGHLSPVAGRRTVSDLIKLLYRKEFCFENFLKRCENVKDCIRFETQVVELEMKDQGFSLAIVKDASSDIECDIYLRSPVRFLKKQIQGCSHGTAVLNPNEEGNEDMTSNPKLARLGKEGVPAIINSIISTSDPYTMWHMEGSNIGESFVGMMQLYSDKSRTTLKESACQFYSFHVTLLIFCEEYRRQCILNGLSLVAFLPVSFFRYLNGERIETGLTRSKRLEMLHLSITHVLSELNNIA